MNEIERVAKVIEEDIVVGCCTPSPREAIEIATAAIAAMRGKPEAWAYDLHTPHHLPEPMPQFVQFNRANMNPKYWTETALYAGPTPPDSGKD